MADYWHRLAYGWALLQQNGLVKVMQTLNFDLVISKFVISHGLGFFVNVSELKGQQFEEFMLNLQICSMKR